MKKLMGLLGVVFLLFESVAWAEPDVTVSGYILTHFEQYLNDEGTYSIVDAGGGDYQAQGKDGFNAFQITRIYLTFNGKLTENISASVTTDVRADSDGYRSLYAKYAFVEFRDLVPGQKIRFGLQDPPWGGYIDGNYSRYRMIDQSFYSYWGTFSTADFGVSMLGDFFNKKLLYHIAVLNGEGLKGAEKDQFKEYVGRLSLDLGSKDKFRIYPSIGYSTHRYNDSSDFKDDVVMAGVGMDYWKIHLAGEYIQGTKTLKTGEYPLVGGVWPSGAVDAIKVIDAGSLLTADKDINYGGFGIYLDVKLTDKLNAFARYDLYDPNLDSDFDKDAQSMWYAGVCYHPWNNVWLSLDYRQSDFQELDIDGDGIKELKPVQVLYTHWKIAY